MMPRTESLTAVGVNDYRLPADTVTEVDIKVTAAMTRPMPVAEQVIEIVSDGNPDFRYTIDGSNPSSSGTIKSVAGMPGFRRGHKCKSIDTVKLWCPSECVVTVRAVQANSIESLSSNSEFDASEDDSPTIARIFDRNGNRVDVAFNCESLTVDDVDGRMRVFSGGTVARSTTGDQRRDNTMNGKTCIFSAKPDDATAEGIGQWRKTPLGSGYQFLGTGGRALSFLLNQVAITNEQGNGWEDFRAAKITGNDVWGTIHDTSDAALKTNVTDLSPGTGLDEILALRPVTFEWINGEAGEQERGLIAQEVGAVIPEAEKVSDEDVHSISPSAIDATLVRAVQQQQESIRQLQATIADLASQIAELRVRVGPDAV